MTIPIPLRKVTHLKLVLPVNEGWVGNQLWVPVSHTELHLACLYFPIAVCFDDRRPCLGLLLGERYLKRPAVDASGKWQGGYKPIALRCFPFQAGEIGEDPLGDILIAFPSDHLTGKDGIPIVDDSGRPSPLIREIHNLFRLLQDSRTKFSDALDRLLISNLLTPLESVDGKSCGNDTPSIYVVDAGRFMEADKMALSAMARQSFTALDVAVACLSSQRLLRDQYRPKPASGTKLCAERAASLTQQFFASEDFNLVLDDDELISLFDIDVLRDGTRPTQPSLGETK
jgi:SapC